LARDARSETLASGRDGPGSSVFVAGGLLAGRDELELATPVVGGLLAGVFGPGCAFCGRSGVGGRSLRPAARESGFEKPACWIGSAERRGDGDLSTSFVLGLLAMCEK